MREHRDVERQVVTRTECVNVVCDCCGRKAEEPASSLPFAWGGIGNSLGTLRYTYSIDGDCETDELDLCYECAEKVAEHIKALRRSR